MKNNHTQKADHFKTWVKPSTINAMANLAELIQSDFIDSPLQLRVKRKDGTLFYASSCLETLGMESRLEPISGVGYDGFIPFQAGGFKITQFFISDSDSCRHFTTAQTDFMDSLVADCAKDFLIDTGKESFDYSAASEAEQAEWEDHERAYFDETSAAILRVELWRGDHEEGYLPSQGFVTLDSGIIFLRVSVGYRDSPYFRSANDETIFEMNMHEEDFLRAGKKKILSRMFQKMRAAIARDSKQKRESEKQKRRESKS